MILVNVSFGIYAFFPQGWIFMAFIILIESIIVSRQLTQNWRDLSIYGRVTISNVVSGIVGILASLKLNGGWWLVVWFPWVSDNEVRLDNKNQIYGLLILYGLAFLLTLLIELPLNRFLLKKYPARLTIKTSLIANLVSYAIGTVVLYSYSFGLI